MCFTSCGTVYGPHQIIGPHDWLWANDWLMAWWVIGEAHHDRCFDRWGPRGTTVGPKYTKWIPNPGFWPDCMPPTGWPEPPIVWPDDWLKLWSKVGFQEEMKTWAARAARKAAAA